MKPLTKRAYTWRYSPRGPLFRMWSNGVQTEARKETP